MTTYDILAYEQGPSYSWLDQIPSFKVIYVCFIRPESGKSIPSETLELNIFQSQPQRKKMRKSVISHSVVSQHSEKYSVFCGATKPFSSRYVEIWEDHQSRREEILNVGVEVFDIESKEWVVLGPVSFLIEVAPFGEGGFRYVFKASSNHHKFRDATYVIKRYKTPSLENIEILKQSPEIQSRKVVQMNSLARNLAARSSDRCATVIEDFSKIVYNKVFFGKIYENEFVTVEKFIPSTFQKYNNNDGTIENGVETFADDLKKVEAFVHYTYKKSEGNLMVLDIQGIGNILCGHEIATEDVVDTDNEFLFCLGNLATNAIQAFLGAHECNAYCETVNFPDKE